jgi:hypothetical protein
MPMGEHSFGFRGGRRIIFKYGAQQSRKYARKASLGEQGLRTLHFGGTP